MIIKIIVISSFVNMLMIIIVILIIAQVAQVSTHLAYTHLLHHGSSLEWARAVRRALQVFKSNSAEMGGAIGRYREFIVFHSEYIYPEYVIAYQRFNNGHGPVG